MVTLAGNATYTRLDKPAGLPTFPQLRSYYDDGVDPGNQPIYTLDGTHTTTTTYHIVVPKSACVGCLIWNMSGLGIVANCDSELSTDNNSEKTQSDISSDGASC